MFIPLGFIGNTIISCMPQKNSVTTRTYGRAKQDVF